MIPLFLLAVQSPAPATQSFAWSAELDAPVERVWQALTSVEALREWKAPTVEVELGVGGLLRMNSTHGAARGHDGDILHAVLAYEPGRMLATHARPPRESMLDEAFDVLRLETLSAGGTRVSISRRYPESVLQANQALLFGLDNEATFDRVRKWTAAQQAVLPAPSAAERALVQNALVVEGTIATGLDELWRVFSTAEGWKLLGVGQADVDLRVGGSITTHFDAQAQPGGHGTIVHRVLAYEDQRMLSTSFAAPTLEVDPSNDKARGALGTWVVITLTPVDATHTTLREAMYGWGDTEEARDTRKFFEGGNRWTMEHLQRHYAPQK
jgi:uncharacterized protein YndB with AHSA1/START domain